MTHVHALILFVYLSASVTEAQELTPSLTLTPAAFPKWDAAAHVTWLGEHRPAESFQQWDRWLGVASGGGTLGYYWTPHLKTEFDLSASSESDTYSVELIPTAGSATTTFVQRDHEVRFITASAGLTRQFFENTWFHPFVGAGLELVREREHIAIVPPPVPPRVTGVSTVPPGETGVRYVSRPYVATGFKLYVSDHVFLRTDIRTSWSRDGLEALGWRSGVGVDF